MTKVKSLITCGILLLVCFSITAQDIRNEILNYQDSNLIIIQNSRKMILESLDRWNIKKASEIKSYLDDEINTERYAVFTLGEELLLDMAIGDYVRPLIIAQYWDSLSTQYYGYPPVQDNFFGTLAKIAVDHRSVIQKNVEDIVVSGEQEDFLKLLFTYLIGIDPTQKISQDSINIRAKEYLDHYQISPYNDFIQKNILYELEPTPLGLSFYIGSGFINLKGSTGDYLDPFVPAQLGLDVLYRRMLISLRITGGAGEFTDQVLVDGDTYNASDLRLNPLAVTVAAGFAVVDSRRIRVVPFLSLGGFSVSPVEEDSDYDFDMSSFAYGPGLLADVKLWQWNNVSYAYGYPSSMANEVGLRLSGEFLKHNFDNTVPKLEGTYCAYGLSVYWIFRGLRQKQYK